MGCHEDGVRVFTVKNDGRRRGNQNKLKQERHKLVPHKDGQAVEGVAHRDCVDPFLGGFQDPTGQSPEQPGLMP